MYNGKLYGIYGNDSDCESGFGNFISNVTSDNITVLFLYYPPDLTVTAELYQNNILIGRKTVTMCITSSGYGDGSYYDYYGVYLAKWHNACYHYSGYCYFYTGPCNCS
ncbi:MAG: hypothetical protein LBE20_06295 [Deltaproteobacteria bacterium]|jgi:hypothetical protein|nr:hypothetical protein [Deltaproteobacteria bacterium]